MVDAFYAFEDEMLEWITRAPGADAAEAAAPVDAGGDAQGVGRPNAPGEQVGRRCGEPRDAGRAAEPIPEPLAKHRPAEFDGRRDGELEADDAGNVYLSRPNIGDILRFKLTADGKLGNKTTFVSGNCCCCSKSGIEIGGPLAIRIRQEEAAMRARFAAY